MQPAALAIICKDQHYVCWVKRADVGIWVLPGGGIEADESAEQAAIREAKEETGLEVTSVHLAATYSPVARWTAPTYLFFCIPISSTLTRGPESVEVAFFPWNQPPPTHFPFHQQWLTEVWNNPNCIRRPLKEVTWQRLLLFALYHPLVAGRFLALSAFRVARRDS